ncbi:MAG: hypothetical protein V1808_03365 [Candidatus Daviesbacteria bacterium]
MDSQTQYQNILTDLIKKQIVMLGPNVALSQARKVEGINVSDDGTVTNLSGDPQAILSAVAKQYMSLSGAIAQMTLESIIAKYPGVKLN